MTTTGGAPSRAHKAARRRPRPRTWVLLALGLFVVWLAVSMALAGWHARSAKTEVAIVTSQLRAGDAAQASDSIDKARTDAAAARSALTSLPIAVLNVVPYFHTNLQGATALLSSTIEVVDAATVANSLYPALTGEGDGSRAIVENGKVDIAELERTAPEVATASGHLNAAEQYLSEVPPDVSPALRSVVDSAAPDVQSLAKALRVYNGLLPELPVLLGKDKPATYLVVIHNPAELYAGGGAALNLALLQFDNGKMRVVDRGDVGHFFPGAPRVPWNPVAGGPYYADKNARDGFAWSNLHQDFRVSGEDMMRSWRANGGPPIDGVISLDPVALEAALTATGPIDSPLFGKVTADNLVQKLLVDAYRSPDQAVRHEMNQELIDDVLARMQEGTTALSVGRAVLATAPGQHVRIHLAGGRLADQFHEAALDGAQPDEQPDRIAFYTQNQNASKVDIFQKRRIRHAVELRADGSATVHQTTKVFNDVPRKGSGSQERTGYTTRWAFHWNIVFLPRNAQDVELSANRGDVRTDDRVFTDVDGRTAVRVGRWIPPGGKTVIKVSYTLPPGTFGGDAALDYRVAVEHQLALHDTDLTVRVTGPSRPSPTIGEWDVQDDTATHRSQVTGPTVLGLRFS